MVGFFGGMYVYVLFCFLGGRSWRLVFCLLFLWNLEGHVLQYIQFVHYIQSCIHYKK